MVDYVATGIIFAVLESPKSFTGTRHVRSCLIIILNNFIFSPSLRSDRGRLSRLLFFLSFSSFICFFGCSDGMEREAYVCDHGFERSDLCAENKINNNNNSCERTSTRW